MPQARVTITDADGRVANGHPWIYASQVLRTEGSFEPGDVVQVQDERRRPVGQGYINPASTIRIRLLARDPHERVDRAFITRRITHACAQRRRMGYEASCRLVFGESDGLPGLVVDRFSDRSDGRTILSVQFLTLGMERWRTTVLKALGEAVAPDGIYLRNDVPIRAKEGLEPETGFHGKPFKTALTMEENGVAFKVDVAAGQKTGHFLDQVRNHAAMSLVSRGARVLDCFTHTGGFGLHAARYGAAEVTGLDSSAEALELARQNAALNGFGTVRFVEANVFDFLAGASRKGDRWDTIVLDPPAFAKSRSAMEGARRGYKEINLRAMQCLPPGGFLVTCSCSQHMTPRLFRSVVADAAHDAGRTLTELYQGTQPPDHPVLWGMPESLYLKCLVLRVDRP